MSDFIEYSAAFHYQNDDIMHYGVKNMRWHHHKRKPVVGIDINKDLENKANAMRISSGDMNITKEQHMYMSKPLSHLSDKALEKRLDRSTTAVEDRAKSGGNRITRIDRGDLTAISNREENRVLNEMHRREVDERLRRRKKK